MPPKDTPLMRQYNEIKAQNRDCILFFRLGDFYEMFDDDAKLVSGELDLTLTTRDRGVEKVEDRTPMCGVPYHSAESYIARLIAKGYKVAICEQTEDPATAKTIVRREVVRIITPGTVMESSMLDEGKNNFLCAVCVGASSAGLCFADISTGEVYATQLSGEELTQRVLTELGRFSPREAILDGGALRRDGITRFLRERLHCALVQSEEASASGSAHTRVLKQFGADSPEALGLEEKPDAVYAVWQVLSYLDETQKGGAVALSSLNVYEYGKFMELDVPARRNLELFESLADGGKKGSLLWVLDQTKTPMGGRLLRQWMENPLLNPFDINRRLDAVEAFVQDLPLRRELIGALSHMPDMERLIGRLVYGTGGGRDAVALGAACEKLPPVHELLRGDTKPPLLRELCEQLDTLEDMRGEIDGTLVPEPPHSIREGGFIKDGFHPEVDRLRGIVQNGRGLVAAMEAEEREKTGIKTLKIGYNRVFGYYIEISKSQYDKAPERYDRRQTLANCERFITPELKEMEATILTAQDRLTALEGELFATLRDHLAAMAHRVQRSAHAVAQLDALLSFAEVAAAHRYVRPTVDHLDVLHIKEGRHPVVERMIPGGLFVPNDVMLSKQDSVAIITGPNMAGKSTYLRQTALITLMAQLGCFVPAKSARVGVCDRIFTRIGASDDLAGGRSTFMVEMTEVADMLKHATGKSLLILDEIGRGTSTFDGMSVARAVVEHVADPKRLGARTLFATHYHELTELEQTLPHVKNFNIAVKRRGDDIIFLRKIVPGGADDSYGVLVAALAGLPPSLIRRAKDILFALESQNAVVPAGDPARASFAHEAPPSPVVERLQNLDPNVVSPIEALSVLFELKKLVMPDEEG